MAKNYTKREAVSIAISASRLYRDNFAGKRLLFLLTDKHKHISTLEVGFDASNFQHLTGIISANKSWSSLDFYNFCIDARLKESDIILSEKGTTHQKLSVLRLAFKNSNLSASMMGVYNNSHPLLYTEKLVGGVKWAIGFRDVTGKGDYVPDTLLEGDIRQNVKITYRIIATYIKSLNENNFEKLIYKAKKAEWDKIRLPDEYNYLSI